MSIPLFRCEGGTVVIPNRELVLVSREDGGNLVVNPPREVWDRSELTPAELTLWAFLVAATARAMLDLLPQLVDGCINYWDAGNWALNHESEPKGPKKGKAHRRVHLHLLGRSPKATHPDLCWGEAPFFPHFADRHKWASGFARLTPEECRKIVVKVEEILKTRYGLKASQSSPWAACSVCKYPTATKDGPTDSICPECYRC